MAMRMNNVLLVGSNPSRRSPNPTAFHLSTKSRSTIEKWFDDVLVNLYFENVTRRPTEDNRPLRVSEIRDAIPDLTRRVDGYDKIVALGTTASKALTMVGVEHFAMPHPSGLCRFWNDKVQAEQKIRELIKYVTE